MQHTALCEENGIHAYPTLRLYVNGKKYGDYKGDRTVRHFTNHLAAVEANFLKESGTVESADLGKLMNKLDLKIFASSAKKNIFIEHLLKSF